jgi:hypothetical protein
VTKLIPLAASSVFLKQTILRIKYTDITILEGFRVLVPRFSANPAVFVYSREGRKVFRYYIDMNDLDDFFDILEAYEPSQGLRQFMIGRFDFRARLSESHASIGIDYLSHDVEINGTISQLNAAIAEYRSLQRGVMGFSPAWLSPRNFLHASH